MWVWGFRLSISFEAFIHYNLIQLAHCGWQTCAVQCSVKLWNDLTCLTNRLDLSQVRTEQWHETWKLKQWHYDITSYSHHEVARQVSCRSDQIMTWTLTMRSHKGLDWIVALTVTVTVGGSLWGCGPVDVIVAPAVVRRLRCSLQCQAQVQKLAKPWKRQRQRMFPALDGIAALDAAA